MSLLWVTAVGGDHLDLYHRTTPENAASIMRTRRFESHPDTPGSIYATDARETPDGSPTWSYGPGVVHLRVPRGIAHVEDDFGDEKHYRVDLSGVRPEHYVDSWEEDA